HRSLLKEGAGEERYSRVPQQSLLLFSPLHLLMDCSRFAQPPPLPALRHFLPVCTKTNCAWPAWICARSRRLNIIQRFYQFPRETHEVLLGLNPNSYRGCGNGGAESN